MVVIVTVHSSNSNNRLGLVKGGGPLEEGEEEEDLGNRIPTLEE